MCAFRDPLREDFAFLFDLVDLCWVRLFPLLFFLCEIFLPPFLDPNLFCCDFTGFGLSLLAVDRCVTHAGSVATVSFAAGSVSDSDISDSGAAGSVSDSDISDSGAAGAGADATSVSESDPDISDAAAAGAVSVSDSDDCEPD